MDPSGSKPNLEETPSMWCVSYKQLLDVDIQAQTLCNAPKVEEDGLPNYSQVTMRDICQHIIIPKCQETGKSYALSLNPDGLPIDAFVTHSWDGYFASFVQSIKNVYQTTVQQPNLWICAFAINQANLDVQDTSNGGSKNNNELILEKSPFVLALQQANTFCVVRNSQTDLYSRIWCVCEVFYANKIGLYPKNTYVTGPDDFAALKTSCLEATAYKEDDREMVLDALLGSNSVKEIDLIVKTFRAHSIPENFPHLNQVNPDVQKWTLPIQPTNLHSDMQGWNIGGYQFEDLIHEGSCVFIYRARQINLNRPVAIYTLSPSCRWDPAYQKAIPRAAEITSGYEHPGIVPVYDFGSHRGIPYIITKYMSGGFLRDYVAQKGQLSHLKIAGIIKQIGCALDHLHAQGQVQGDPCTNTIAMDGWGNAYISDFIKRATDETGPSAILGMPAYIAPERWMGNSSTPATDQYALGCIAYELVTGRVPFDEAISLEDLKNLHMAQPPTSPRKFRPNLSQKVEKALLRSLEKDPTCRYPTTMTFAREFEIAMLDAPTHIVVSHPDGCCEYAQRLRINLSTNGFQVLGAEESLCDNSNDAIRVCAALVILMTPEGHHSNKLQKGIELAKRYSKPIFPILLEDAVYPSLFGYGFEDARDDALPGPGFYRRLSQSVYGDMI